MNTAAVLAGKAAVFLSQQPGEGDNGGQGEDFGKSSPVGLLVLILFLIAVALLVRSMTKHLKRVPATFDPEEAAELEKQKAEAEKPAADPAEDEPKPEDTATTEADEPTNSAK